MKKRRLNSSEGMFVTSCDSGNMLNVSPAPVCHSHPHSVSSNTNNNYPASNLAPIMASNSNNSAGTSSGSIPMQAALNGQYRSNQPPHHHQQHQYYYPSASYHNNTGGSQFSQGGSRRGGFHSRGGIVPGRRGSGYNNRGVHGNRLNSHPHYLGSHDGPPQHTAAQQQHLMQTTSNNHNYMGMSSGGTSVSGHHHPGVMAPYPPVTSGHVLDQQACAAAMLQAMHFVMAGSSLSSSASGSVKAPNPPEGPQMNLLGGSNAPSAQSLASALSNPQAWHSFFSSAGGNNGVVEGWHNAMINYFAHHLKSAPGTPPLHANQALCIPPSSSSSATSTTNSFGLENIKLQNEGLQREHSYQQLRAVSGSAHSERQEKTPNPTVVPSTSKQSSVATSNITSTRRRQQNSNSPGTLESRGGKGDNSLTAPPSSSMVFTLSSDESCGGEDSQAHEAVDTEHDAEDEEDEDEASVSLSANIPRGGSSSDHESEEESRGHTGPILPEVMGGQKSAGESQPEPSVAGGSDPSSAAFLPHPVNNSISCGTYEDQVSERIWHFYLENRQTDDTYHRKIQLRNALHIVMSYVFQEAGLFVVGSSMNGFGNDNSDMDLCLTLTAAELSQKKEAQVVLHELVEPLQKCSFIQRLQLIRAKVPILKFHDRHARVDCDLNINNVVGIYNTHLLAMYTRVDWRVRPLGMFVKHWAVHMDIHDASRGRISTYTLILMLIHYLQSGCKPPVLPSLQASFPNYFSYERGLKEVDMRLSLPWDELQSHNTSSLHELFLGFLEYYAERFDFSKWAVSVRTGKAIPIDAAIKQLPPHEQLQAATSFKIFVQEPFNLNNTARALFDEDIFRRVQRAFTTSVQVLRRHGDLAQFLYNASSNQ